MWGEEIGEIFPTWMSRGLPSVPRSNLCPSKPVLLDDTASLSSSTSKTTAMSRSSGRLLVFVCLLLLIAQCCAQSSPSSASTSASRSLSSSSAAAVPSARPVLSVATRVSLSENSTYTFVLNTTHPAVIATLPTVTGAIEVLLNIENLGPQDELPRALASTNPDTLSFGGRYSYDRSSGGTTLGGWNRYYAPSTWEVTWDRGFGNWTNGANRNGEVQEHDPVVPHLLIGRGVNDAGVVQGVKGGNVTVRVSFVMFSECGVAIS